MLGLINVGAPLPSSIFPHNRMFSMFLQYLVVTGNHRQHLAILYLVTVFQDMHGCVVEVGCVPHRSLSALGTTA